MKKHLFVLVSVVLLLLAGCASTSGVIKASSGDFIIESDAVTGVDKIFHKEFSESYFFNLQDSLWGERENLDAYLVDGNFFIGADYQYSKWLFIESLVFLGANNKRLEISNGHRSGDVVTGAIVRERFVAGVSESDVLILKEILQNKPSVAFVGKQWRTDVFTIKPVIANALLATIERGAADSKQ